MPTSKLQLNCNEALPGADAMRLVKETVSVFFIPKWIQLFAFEIILNTLSVSWMRNVPVCTKGRHGPPFI